MSNQHNSQRDYKRIVLFGAGRHAMEVRGLFAETVLAMGYCFVAHWVDAAYANSARNADIVLVTDLAQLSCDEWCVLPALQSGSKRAQVTSDALGHRIALAPAVTHPRAFVAETVRIGAASLVFPGAVVSTNVVLGDNCVVHVNATVTHDCVIEDFAFVGPGATLCGGVVVEREALIGAGAVVLPNVRIGRQAVVGAGTVVTRDVPASAVVKGVRVNA
jgi:sugar O-acyltransferase (sialic acid O-acetyltransferase NeuD family)